MRLFALALGLISVFATSAVAAHPPGTGKGRPLVRSSLPQAQQLGSVRGRQVRTAPVSRAAPLRKARPCCRRPVRRALLELPSALRSLGLQLELEAMREALR